MSGLYLQPIGISFLRIDIDVSCRGSEDVSKNTFIGLSIATIIGVLLL